MKEYWGSKCPVCMEHIKEEDDIVVCPDCGTPYHRACYSREGHCINQELHERHEFWMPEKKPEEERFCAAVPHRCPKCATMNPPEGIFCQICGYPLKDNAEEVRGKQPGYINPNPYTTPFGGVSPDEEIDGVSVREMALFIGNNSHFFIPRFFKQCAGRVFTWNWPAFWFRGLYFFYRKMYLAGIVALLLNLLLSMPATLASLAIAVNRSVIFGMELTTLYQAATLCNFLSLLLAVGCAVFANHVYCRRVIGKIRGMRRDGDNPATQEYADTLMRRGGTNRLLVILFIAAWIVFSMIVSYLLVMFAA